MDEMSCIQDTYICSTNALVLVAAMYNRNMLIAEGLEAADSPDVFDDLCSKSLHPFRLKRWRCVR
ncbi:hypothetical protein K523DRAFT_323074 [Schizophyllum commune Tattone D]|nr:hypothetical protein K523DRAFT_323074 [Schizophyllum commune Tattone D]